MKISFLTLNRWLKVQLDRVDGLLKTLDGNKTLIGFVYFTFEHYLPVSVYFDILTTIVALWTGYGVYDKFKKFKKR